MPKRNLPEFHYDEKRQQYRKRITLPDGRKKDLYAKDKEVLRKRVAALRREIEEYGYDAEDPTLAEYAIQWCARRLPGLSEARKNDYRNAINNHILPGLDGNKRLREISTADVDAFMAAKALVSSSLHGKIISTLKQMFAAAVREGKLRSSPAEHVRAGGKKAAEKVPLSESQQTTLIQAVTGTPALPFVMLGLYAGLRKEEILGLQWDCVHLSGSAPYLSVERTCTFEGNKAVVTSQLKTKAARRKIPLPPPLLHCLQSWRIQNPHDFVVPNSEGGPAAVSPFAASGRSWRTAPPGPFTAGTGSVGTICRCNAHWERRSPTTPSSALWTSTAPLISSGTTYITSLCASGLDIKKIQYLAGHANVQMTLNIYAHVVDNRPEDLFADVCTAFQAASNVPPVSTP